MRFANLIMLALSCACSGLAEVPSYRGLMKVWTDLSAPEGNRLEQGEYAIEVKQMDGRYVLRFSQDEQIKASVNGQVLGENSHLPGGIPLIGTHYLRSSEEPIRREEERQMSRTGLAHYQDEPRAWHTSIRVYPSEDHKHAVFLFSQKLPRSQWRWVVFELLITGNSSRQ